MRIQKTRALVAAAAASAPAIGGALAHVTAHAPPAPGGRGGGRGGIAPALFTAIDANKDGAVTRDEFKGAFDKWFGEWDTANAGALGAAEIGNGLTKVVAAFAPAPPAGGGGQQDAC